jgi:hypothetical protein
MKKLLTILFFIPLFAHAQTYQWTDIIYDGCGEYAHANIAASTLFLYGISGNPALMGTNNTGTPGIPGHAITSPTNLQFLSTWGALHGYYAIDNTVNHYAWVIGDNSDGQYGDGTSTATLVANKIATDSAGNAFTGLVEIAFFFTGNAHNGALGLKSDGTVWVWGNLTDNMRGNGTGGSTFVKPVQVIIPGGRTAIQVLAGYIALVLCSDGTVWSWGSGAGTYLSLGYAGSGSQWATIRQVTGLTGITQIAGGLHWSYGYNATTNKLYRWGYAGNYIGKSGGGTSGAGVGVGIPEEATELESALGMPALSLKQIVTNYDATACIMSDGTLHAWGDAVEGCVGNGVEENWATYSTPYANNLGTLGQLLQITPVQLGYKTDWKAVYGGGPFVCYFVARDAAGNEYVWGRNKGLVIAPFGLASSNLVGTYPNSTDILEPTKINPYAATKVWAVTSPWCLSNPAATYCSDFTHGAYGALTVNAGSNQSVTTNVALLSGTISDTAIYRHWDIVSGPGSPHIRSATDSSSTVFNLSPGSTTIRYMGTNNGFATYSNTVTITYIPTNCNCTIQSHVPIKLH